MVVRALEFGPDHVHLFVGNCKKYSVPQIAQYFKGASSRELCERYWEHVRKGIWWLFLEWWLLYESVGRVTSESVEYYINRQQGKHWANIDYDVFRMSHMQKTINDFSIGTPDNLKRSGPKYIRLTKITFRLKYKMLWSRLLILTEELSFILIKKIRMGSWFCYPELYWIERH